MHQSLKTFIPGEAFRIQRIHRQVQNKPNNKVRSLYKNVQFANFPIAFQN